MKSNNCANMCFFSSLLLLLFLLVGGSGDFKAREWDLRCTHSHILKADQVDCRLFNCWANIRGWGGGGGLGGRFKPKSVTCGLAGEEEGIHCVTTLDHKEAFPHNLWDPWLLRLVLPLPFFFLTSSNQSDTHNNYQNWVLLPWNRLLNRPCEAAAQEAPILSKLTVGGGNPIHLLLPLRLQWVAMIMRLTMIMMRRYLNGPKIYGWMTFKSNIDPRVTDRLANDTLSQLVGLTRSAIMQRQWVNEELEGEWEGIGSRSGRILERFSATSSSSTSSQASGKER